MDLVIMDSDMDTTDTLMLIMAKGLLMLNQRRMLTPTSSMVDTMVLDTMDSDMDTTDTLMLIMAKGLLMLSLRLMLILIFSTVDTMALAMDIPMLVTPITDKLSTKEKETPAPKET